LKIRYNQNQNQKRKLTMKNLLLSLALILILPIAASAYVETFWDDPSKNYAYDWSAMGWHSGDNHHDVIGHGPYISGGSLSFDDGTGHLTSVAFNYTGLTNPMGDLFIDVGNDNDFDYVLNIATSKVLTIEDSVLSTHRGADWTPWNPDDLYLTSDTESPYPNYRNHHFVALDVDAMESGDYSEGETFNATNDVPKGHWDEGSYLFSDFDLAIDDVFSITFAPTCANDVIQVQSSAVPVPSALLLLGGGLIGLIGVRRKSILN
jgi:hypothetical protein